MSKKKEQLFIVIDLLLAVVLLISLSKTFSLQIPSSKASIEQKAKSIVSVCSKAKEGRDKCYKKTLVQLTKDKNIFFTQKVLYAIQSIDIDPYVRNCHVLSHDIAEAAARKDPSKWRELMDKVDVNTCGGGFLHGILVVHTGDDPNFKVDSSFVNQVCYKGQHTFKERTCSHILGHIIALNTEGKIDPGLEICEKTHPSFSDDCYNGVFMEESFKLTLVDHGLAKLPVRDERRMITQEKRCLKYTGRPGVACWVDMAEIFVEFYNYDAAKTYESCNRAPEESERKQCYLKGVILMAVSPNYDSEDNLLSACAPYTQNEKLYSQCTNYIIASLMAHSASFADRGIKLCTNIDDKYKKNCFKDLGEQLAISASERSDRQELCRSTPEEYRSICIN